MCGGGVDITQPPPVLSRIIGGPCPIKKIFKVLFSHMSKLNHHVSAKWAETKNRLIYISRRFSLSFFNIITIYSGVYVTLHDIRWKMWSVSLSGWIITMCHNGEVAESSRYVVWLWQCTRFSHLDLVVRPLQSFWPFRFGHFGDFFHLARRPVCTTLWGAPC